MENKITLYIDYLNRYYNSKEIINILVQLVNKNSVSADILNHICDDNIFKNTADVKYLLEIDINKLFKEDLSILDNSINLPIEKLNLSNRTYNCLRRNSLLTIKDIIEKNELEIMNLSNLGRTSFNELVSKLSILGFRLKDSDGLDNSLNSKIIKIEDTNLHSLDYDKLINMSISNLNLSVRSNNALMRENIKIIKDLLEYTDEMIKHIKNLGTESFKEIKKKLTELGLKNKESIIYDGNNDFKDKIFEPTKSSSIEERINIKNIYKWAKNSNKLYVEEDKDCTKVNYNNEQLENQKTIINNSLTIEQENNEIIVNDYDISSQKSKKNNKYISLEEKLSLSIDILDIDNNLKGKLLKLGIKTIGDLNDFKLSTVEGFYKNDLAKLKASLKKFGFDIEILYDEINYNEMSKEEKLNLTIDNFNLDINTINLFKQYNITVIKDITNKSKNDIIELFDGSIYKKIRKILNELKLDFENEYDILSFDTPEILNKEIKILKFSFRTYRLLIKNNIKFVKDLLFYSDDELINICKSHNSSFSEIKAIINKYDLENMYNKEYKNDILTYEIEKSGSSELSFKENNKNLKDNKLNESYEENTSNKINITVDNSYIDLLEQLKDEFGIENQNNGLEFDDSSNEVSAIINNNEYHIETKNIINENEAIVETKIKVKSFEENDEKFEDFISFYNKLKK